jgi:ubiquinone biosynthesis protein
MLRLGRSGLAGGGPSRAEVLGAALAGMLEALGGGFLKVGQILSTRVDLFPEAVLRPLRQLQDNVAPLPAGRVRRTLEASLGAATEELFDELELQPLASASVSQVHRAVLPGTRKRVAVKVRRPGIERLVAADCRLLRSAAWLLALLPPFRRLPVREAVGMVCAALAAQTDFVREAQRLRRYKDQCARDGEVIVPGVIDRLCTRDVVTMEYVTARGKVTEPGIELPVRRAAVTFALRAIYQSIFVHGFFHCDLHPGNLLVAADGAAVVLDLGYVAEFRPAHRRAFAEFFLSIAVRDGERAARIVRETARYVPRGLDAGRFEADIADLIRSCSGLRVGEFQVVRFVSDLFRVQHCHRIAGSPEFTLAILALLAFEGTIKAVDPDLDFQREAVPSILAALRQ